MNDLIIYILCSFLFWLQINVFQSTSLDQRQRKRRVWLLAASSIEKQAIEEQEE